jgi:hypothetical protein
MVIKTLGWTLKIRDGTTGIPEAQIFFYWPLTEYLSNQGNFN